MSKYPRTPSKISHMPVLILKVMLSINHNAKGLTYWIYPSTDEVNIESGKFGKVFQTLPGLGFVFGTNSVKDLVVDGLEVDASAWILDGKMMVGIASSSYESSDETFIIELPAIVDSVDVVFYGAAGKFLLRQFQVWCWYGGAMSLPYNTYSLL